MHPIYVTIEDKIPLSCASGCLQYVSKPPSCVFSCILLELLMGIVLKIFLFLSSRFLSEASLQSGIGLHFRI